MRLNSLHGIYKGQQVKFGGLLQATALKQKAVKFMQVSDQNNNRELNRGLRSSIALILFCIFGTALATWVTYEARHLEGHTPLVTISQPSIDETRLAAIEPDRIPFLAHSENSRTGKLERRSTPLKVLRDLGAEGRESYTALQAIYEKDLVDPRRLQAGLPIKAYFDPENQELLSVSMRVSSEKTVFAKRMADGAFFATALTTKLTKTYKRVDDEIATSFYEAAIAAGLKDKQVADFAQIFAFDVDFQREVRVGDRFEIVYETFNDERGNQVRTGDVLFAAYNGQSTQRDYYRHTPEDDKVPDYFTSDGKAATRFLMKTPINGARLSSSFGRRRHPISGYSRLHKGTDFAARSGTPIFAAGNGVVERASRYGGYGKYARIQHANGYETAYAHMSRYGPGIKKGRLVRQGDIIGYVGSTGASTGPHLHYEVLINGKHVNAMALKLPTGRTLEGDLLESFQKTRVRIDNLRKRHGANITIAAL